MDAGAPRARAPRLSKAERESQELAAAQAAAAAITLPHEWTPHPWQDRALAAYRRGIRRFLLIVHRRAGKDQLALNMAAIASQERVGSYLHVFPYANQVRRAIWRGADKRDGRRFVDQAFPQALRTATRDSPMEIEFLNSSIWSCCGSDNREALRGGNPVGVTFSEWAFCNPEAWRIVSPILRENDGWAAFITTPFGKNHAYTMFLKVRNNPAWHVEYLTVEDTCDAAGNRLITDADIEAERLDGTPEASIQQEYYCDWTAIFKGAYFAEALARMRQQKRVGPFEYEPGRPVSVAWYTGEADDLIALFFQQHGHAHYCVGSRAWEFKSYDTALQDCARLFPWGAGARHFVPEDFTTQRLFERAGHTVHAVPEYPPGARIALARELFPTLWIDDAPRPWAPDGNNARLLEALAGYRCGENTDGDRKRTPAATWEAPYAEALCRYATADDFAMLIPGEWGPAPDYRLQDRATV